MTDINFRLRWYQTNFWDAFYENRYDRFIEIAHRRWGKDEVVLNLTRHAALDPECGKYRIGNYWHCLPEYAQGRKALWEAVNAHTGKRRIFEAFPEGTIKRMDSQTMFIEFINGSTWQIIGSDSFDATVGSGPVGITYSEWALANPSAWAYHRPMIMENNGWASFITTPRGRNHAKDMFDYAVTNDKWFAEVSSIRDTNALTAEQEAESLDEYTRIYGEDLGRAQFEQEYLCSFNAAILGAFYAKEMVNVRNEGRIRPLAALPGRPVHTAWDIGVKDDTSIWWFQIQGDKICILDCYTASGGDVEFFAELCHEKPYVRGVDYVPHDAKVKEWGTGRTRVETMKQFGLNPSLIPLSTKLDGINAVRRTLPKCVFDPKCEETGIAALEQYRREWDDERKTFKATEVHDWTSHLADAFRYLSMAWRTAPVEKVIEKPFQPPGQVVLEGPPKPQSGTRIRL